MPYWTGPHWKIPLEIGGCFLEFVQGPPFKAVPMGTPRSTGAWYAPMLWKPL